MSFSGSPVSIALALNEIYTSSNIHTNARALQDQWAAQSPSAYDNLLAGFDEASLGLSVSKRFGWHNLNSNGTTIFNDDFVALGVAHEMKVLVLGTGAVDVCVCTVGPTASITAFLLSLQLKYLSWCM